MTPAVRNIPWDLLTSSFEWRSSNPCKEDAKDFHWSREPTRGKNLNTFVEAFAKAVQESAACEPTTFPEEYDKPGPDDVVLSDEVCHRIMPTVHQWRSTRGYRDYNLKFTTALCTHEHTETSAEVCACALPRRERKFAAFCREKQDNDCFEFHYYNQWPFFNLEVFKILLLGGEMDTLLRILSDPMLLLFQDYAKTYPKSWDNPFDPYHELKFWWGAQACYCEGPDLGWEHVAENALRAYLLLNMVQHLPEMWESVDGTQRRYLNTRSYQATVRTITRCGGNSDVATYPHRKFFGIANEQFKVNWKPKNGEMERENCEPVILGKTSYQGFLTHQKSVGYVPLASDVDEVRSMLQSTSLPREIVDEIMDMAQYGDSTRLLPIEHDPFHPENRTELETYLSYCWKLMVWSQLVADEIGMDLRWEDMVSKMLIDMFRCDCDHWNTSHEPAFSYEDGKHRFN